MVTSSDKAYKKTKLIKQGKRQIEEKFKPLAKWISENYEVFVLDIQENLMKHNNNVRIAVHLETQHDAMKFRKGTDYLSGFDSKKQNEVAEKYIEIGKLLKTPRKGFLGKFFKKNPNMNDIFVSFSAFDRIAKIDANELIPEKRVKQLYEVFELPEIWTISRCFDSATLFVYKDDQKEQIKNSAEFKLIENNYFELLKEYDEFNYWKRKHFGIEIDSKQNFDENYKSNWYYYYK